MSRVIKYSPLSTCNEDKQPIEIKPVNSFQPLETFRKTDKHMETAQNDARKESESIIKKAKRDADQLLKNAEREIDNKNQKLIKKEASIDQQIETARSNAALEGYQSGYQNGMEKVKQEYEATLNEAKRILSITQSHYKKKIQDSEPEIIQLSVEIASKVVGEKLAFEESWKHYIRETLKQVKGEEDIKLFVSPKYYDLTSSLIREINTQLNTVIVIYPDDTNQDQSCIIETKYGQIDASVDSQLSEIKEKLLELVGEENGHQTNVNGN